MRVLNTSVPPYDPPKYKTEWPSESIYPQNMETLFARQMFQESKFDNNLTSPKGAQGLAQFMPITQRDMAERFGFEEGWDPNDPQLAKEAQQTYFTYLYMAPWNNGDEEVKLAKALAAYNYGERNMKNFLRDQRAKGVDIYTSTDWVNDLNKETRDYVNEILYGFSDKKKQQLFNDRLERYYEYYPSLRGYINTRGATYNPPTRKLEPTPTPEPEINFQPEPTRVESTATEGVISKELQNALKILKRDAVKYHRGGYVHKHPHEWREQIGDVSRAIGSGFSSIGRDIQDVAAASILGKFFGIEPSQQFSEPPAPRRNVPDILGPNYPDDPAGLPSTFDALFEWTPADDITQLINSVINTYEGEYLQAALAPLMIVLPPALGKKLQAAVRKSTPANVEGVGDEIMAWRSQQTPEMRRQIDEAYMEVNNSIPYDPNPPAFGSPEWTADALLGNRQRNLGYTGSYGAGNTPGSAVGGDVSPVMATTGQRMGGPPIASGDPFGMSVVTGTPTDRAVINSLVHQSHGSVPGTGIIPLDEMQTLTRDIDLNRVPVPGANYTVIRGGMPMQIPTTQMMEGDLITSLSQQGAGRYKGGDRLVSTSPNDMEHLYASFGKNKVIEIDDEDVFSALAGDSKFNSLPVGVQNDILEKITQVDMYSFDPTMLGEKNIMIKELNNLLDSHGLGSHKQSLTASEDVQNALLDDILGPNPFDDDFGGSSFTPDIDDIDPRNTAFKIIHTQDMPVLRQQMFYPNRSVPGAYGAENEFGISALQPFRVVTTGAEESGVPIMLLRPDYKDGGKYKILKK